MKHFLTILLLATTSTAALAAPITTQMTCSQAQGVVARSGGAVLYTGTHTYDRYVSNRGQCLITQVSQPAFIPTRDTPSCHVGSTCVEPDHERDSVFDR